MSEARTPPRKAEVVPGAPGAAAGGEKPAAPFGTAEFATRGSDQHSLQDEAPRSIARREGPVEIPLPDGRTITMARPKTPVLARVAKWLGQESLNGYYLTICRAAMFVTAVDGNQVRLPHDELTLQKRLEELGDDGAEAAVNALLTYWPPLGPGDLPK